MAVDDEKDWAEVRHIGIVRLLIGALQGLGLWLLAEYAAERTLSGAERPWFMAGVVMLLATGPVLLSAVGALGRRTAIVWGLAAAALSALFGWVEGWRGIEEFHSFPSPLVCLGVGGGLFVAHALIVAAVRDRARIAQYPTYFDIAWKHGVQLALAGAFTGAFWAVLGLGAALFNVIGIRGFGEVIAERWFAIPATALAFAAAVHLTDVRLGLIRGVRGVALTLLGWLVPLIAGLALAFLLALPFTGLKLLWETRSASAILISAMTALVLLINAAYQDGGRDKAIPAVLSWAMRLAALLLTPLFLLATYALMLRIGQHGLTIDRILAAACLVVAGCYALGYGIAAFWPGPAMRKLEPTNIVTAFVALAVLLVLLTPVADPVRLSVDSQLGRLRAGVVALKDFDFRYLRFETGQVGRKALERLKAAGGPTGKEAEKALQMDHRYQDTVATVDDQLRLVRVFPAGRTLPAGLLASWADGAGKACDDAAPGCEVYLVDLDQDGTEEAIVSPRRNSLLVFAPDAKGAWLGVAKLEIDRWCDGEDSIREGLRTGRFAVKPGRWRELEIDGRRLSPATRNPPCKGDRPGFDGFN
ncbi:MAG TPA: DUF4153 domain-containing protein [Caulobacter sp.]|nr:DUF4153 domain-containing protein [Caulobacter sp.]